MFQTLLDYYEQGHSLTAERKSGWEGQGTRLVHSKSLFACAKRFKVVLSDLIRDLLFLK